MADFGKMINDGVDAAKHAKDRVTGHNDGQDHAADMSNEAMQEMKRRSQGGHGQAGQFVGALNDGNISNVLQDKIRQKVLGAMPKDQAHIYQEEERQFGQAARNRGPAHLLVERNVQQAEHMILGQAIRQSGVGKIHDVEDAIRVFRNPKAARPEDWIKLGLTVGTHGMLPREIADPVSASIAHQTGQFFNGQGHGTFSDVQHQLQVGMRSMRPVTDKVETVAGEAASKGKEAATGIGKWFRGHVVDPAKERMNKHEE